MIKTLIVDDERLARKELIRLLQKHSQIKIVGEASSADKALQFLETNEIDLVFLDIQMPGMTGMELAEKISSSVQFVFCTAFNEYAIDAFSLNAVDYLLKPVNADRLSGTLERVQCQSEAIDSSNYLSDSHGLFLKFGEMAKIIRLGDVERFESIANHSAVYTTCGKSFIHTSLSRIEKRLSPQIFFRVSRSDIIRIDKIIRLEPGVGVGTLLAVMQLGQEVEVSRRQAQALKQLFSAW